MRIIVEPHICTIDKTPVNEKEINVTKVYFNFSEEITNEFVKEAYFTYNGNSYKQIIVNNECDIPNEVLQKKGSVELGVVAKLVDLSDNTIKQYNPSPCYFDTWKGSLKEAENSEPITPTDKEQMEQAIQNVTNQMNNLDIDAEKVDHTTTITITKKDGTQETTEIYDGTDGQDGVDGITPTIGNNGNWYIGDTDTGKPSRGLTGETGPAGQDGYTPVKGVDYFTPEDIASLNIPSKTSQLQNDSGYVKSSDLSSVATSGSYNDLSNKPDLSNYITKDVNDLTNYYKKTETYTQSEIDTKLTAVYKYKGTVSTYADLPSTGLTIGDVYNVESDGSNYAWTGTEWDKLGGTIDLTNYYTKTETNTLLSGKQNTIDSSHKLSADLVDDTNSTNKFVSSSDITNWNGKLDRSKVKNANSTTAGDVYDVRYINTLIGDIASAIDLINGESL